MNENPRRQLQQNLHNLQAEIAKLAPSKSHTPLLLAVSKKQSIEAIKQIYDYGIRDFAESFIQEAVDKIPKLPPNICWHYIGKLQSNKLKKVAQFFDWVHTLSQVNHTQKLQLHAQEYDKKIQVCIQINIDLEPQKSGILVTEIKQINALVDYMSESCPNLVLRGLMCILQESDNYQLQMKSFTQLAMLQKTLNQQFGLNMDQLSMGMSGDMNAAIATGSTMLRVGSAIFG